MDSLADFLKGAGLIAIGLIGMVACGAIIILPAIVAKNLGASGDVMMILTVVWALMLVGGTCNVLRNL